MALVASVAQWVEGARPRTLPNAVAPVVAGTGAAAWLDGAVWWKALLALIVAVAMIVGVNYANDYSDGIRGTDDVRAGPLRLVGSRLATPRSVLTAAVVSFGVAAAAGVALAVVSAPWLIVVGGLCIAGAWLYTGGTKPYGYLGLGEVAVFVFFGLVAVLGTQYTQAGGSTGSAWPRRWPWVDVVGSPGGQQSARHSDRPGSREDHAGRPARRRPHPAAVSGLLAVALVMTLLLMIATPWCAVGAGRIAVGLRAARPVRTGGVGKDLIPVLRDTGLTMLVWSVAVALALWLGLLERAAS